MKLADWIETKGMSRKDVADLLGVSPPYVTNLCSDVPSWPSRDVMSKLRELTDGAVSSADFMPDIQAAE